MIDLISLEQGMSYENLKESYIIFICTSDPFDENLGRYTISNLCHENIKIPFTDKRTILFYNTKGNLDNISENTKDFLNYINAGAVNGHFIKKLDDAVKFALQNKERRAEYMHSIVHDWDMINKGKREGHTKGVIDTLIALVADKDISIETAAKKLICLLQNLRSI